MKSIMKTPREILLERHRAAETRLNAICSVIVENMNHKESKRQSSFLASLFLRCSQNFWRELLWPSPWAWAGAAAAWVLIFALNFAASAGPDGVSMANTRPLPASVVEMALAERQSLMTSLLDSSPMEPAAPPRELIRPRPRSERKSEWFCA
jgi:hypothetical protein